LDLEAPVYTWLAVVYGNQFCDASWIKPVYNSQELEMRDQWLEHNKDCDHFISRAAAVIPLKGHHGGFHFLSQSLLAFSLPSSFSSVQQ